MAKAIEIKKLVKSYGDKRAVDELELNVEEGELLALLGVNGAGKTTTIKMLSCLLTPTSGDALILGNSIVSEPQKVKSCINISPQETAVAPNLTVRENLELIAGIYGCSRNESRSRANEMIDELGMREVASQRAKTLSGGWQRRLSIAMALISKPKVLFLDEPTLGLDVLARRELWKLINGLKGKATVILTTHYLEEAESLSDHVAIMANGRLRAWGTAEEICSAAGTTSFEDAFVSMVSGGGEI